jgi:hypothetical protein
MPVVAIITQGVEEAMGDTCTLNNVHSLPDAVLAYIRGKNPNYKLKYSKMAEERYFANTCPKCGVLSGDFFLHGAPDAPFFPLTEESAAKVTLERIPVDEPLDIDCAYGAGGAMLLMEHAQMNFSSSK